MKIYRYPQLVVCALGLFSLLLALPVSAQEQAPPATIEFRKLKELLPERIGNFKRVSATGERTSAFGISVSYAEAEYQDEGEGRITVKISDLGGMPGMSELAVGAWESVDMERETETGFERTATYKGHKIMEKYDRAEQSGEINLMVGSRISVEITGYGVAYEVLRGAIDALPLDQLQALAAP